ncbi:hypothetical protein ACFQX7_37695 [Luedemannella flava]
MTDPRAAFIPGLQAIGSVGVGLLIIVVVPVAVFLLIRVLRVAARWMKESIPPCPGCGVAIDAGMLRKPARPVVFQLVGVAMALLVFASIVTCVVGLATAVGDMPMDGPQWYVPLFLTALGTAVGSLKLMLILFRPPVAYHPRCGWVRKDP